MPIKSASRIAFSVRAIGTLASSVALAVAAGPAAAQPASAALGDLDEGGRAIIERMAKDLAGAEGAREFRRLPERDKNRLRRKAADQLLQRNLSRELPVQPHGGAIVRGVEI